MTEDSSDICRTPQYPNLPILLEQVGSKGFAQLRAAGMNGMYLTDQALHQTALLVSALLITRL
ncbi:hypothetical protein [Streptomyces tauricus]|uniref:hypothetical protein n=1 Tax=Streptomyces tauricus TaxID=68274 RepID=UPI003412378F